MQLIFVFTKMKIKNWQVPWNSINNSKSIAGSVEADLTRLRGDSNRSILHADDIAACAGVTIVSTQDCAVFPQWYCNLCPLPVPSS